MDKDAKISMAAFDRLCQEQIPLVGFLGFVTESIEYGKARVRLPANGQFSRPGGSIAGPVQMALADIALYAALLGAIGETPMAVTSSMTINFLKRPGLADLVAEANFIKLGNRLAVGDVFLFSEGIDGPVGHVVGTYSIPTATT